VKEQGTAVLLALCAAAALAAQEGTDTSAVSLLNAADLRNYSKPFLNSNGTVMSSKYLRVASSEDRGRFRDLGGDPALTDTPLEIALLSTCAGVVDVRPVEASTILGNAKQADLKLGAAVYQEMQMLRFLSNTDAVGRHEGIIKFITDRGNVSRTEIETYLKGGITEVVNAEFNAKYGDFIPATVYGELKKIGEPDALALVTNAVAGFFIDPNKNTYAALTGIYARYWLRNVSDGFNQHSFGYSASESFYRVLEALSLVLAERMSNDVSRTLQLLPVSQMTSSIIYSLILPASAAVGNAKVTVTESVYPSRRFRRILAPWNHGGINRVPPAARDRTVPASPGGSLDLVPGAARFCHQPTGAGLLYRCDPQRSHGPGRNDPPGVSAPL
jgi:hypothetical protein